MNPTETSFFIFVFSSVLQPLKIFSAIFLRRNSRWQILHWGFRAANRSIEENLNWGKMKECWFVKEAKSSTMTAVKRNIQKLVTTDLGVECLCKMDCLNNYNKTQMMSPNCENAAAFTLKAIAIAFPLTPTSTPATASTSFPWVSSSARVRQIKSLQHQWGQAVWSDNKKKEFRITSVNSSNW